MIGEYTVEGTDEDVGTRRRIKGSTSGTSTDDVDGPDSGNRGGGEGNMKVDGRQNSTANNSWLIYAAICKLLSHTQSNVYYT